MNTTPLQLLLVEDSPSDAYMIKMLLQRTSARQVHIVQEAYLTKGLQHLQNAHFDVMLLDITLPDSQGLETFIAAQAQAIDLPIVVLTGLNDRRFALEAMRAGAQDYLAKEELTGHLLDRTIHYAIERKQHERERGERQMVFEAQERLALVGRMAAGIAHDFNNILSVITLYTQLLRNNPPAAKSEQYLNTISVQTGNAAKLVKQILDFSRRSSMQYTPLDLAAILEDTVQLLGTMLPENIVVEYRYEPGAYWVKADRSHLEQAILNLSLNARDAMPQGGRLLFTLQTLTVESGGYPQMLHLGNGMWVTLSIEDSGTGIPPEVLPHIFEPFFTTKAVGKGSGLGLAQVYGIVKQHDGDVAVSSQTGEGTTFTVYLPMLSQDGALWPASTRIETMQRGVGTILVVEDDPALCEALSTFLEMLGYQILFAADGDEGIAVFDQSATKIDLVLSDIMMPSKSGIELYYALKARQPTIKVILTTGYPLEDDARSLLEQGMISWIQKPYSLDLLAKIIHSALNNSALNDTAPNKDL